MTRMRWGGINSGESRLASNHFLMCTPQLDLSEMFMELYREEKKEEGDRGGQEDKRGINRRETDLANNQFPKCSPQPGTHKEIHRVG